MNERDKLKLISDCNKRGIKVYPIPVPGSKGQARPKCQICVNRDGVVEILPDIYYQNQKLYDAIIEIYINS